MSQMEAVPTDLGQKIQSKLQKKLSGQIASSKGKKSHPKESKSAIPDTKLDAKFSKELESLGGNKEDLAMFNDIGDSGSDSELDIGSGGKNIDKSEVSDFMKTLGFKEDESVTHREIAERKNKKKDTKSEKVSRLGESAQGAISAKESNEAKKEAKRLAKKAEKQLRQDVKQPVSENTRTPNGVIDTRRPNQHIQFGDSTSALEPNPQWYSPDLDPPKEAATKLSEDEIQELHSRAQNMLNKYNETYEHENTRSSSEKQFMTQLLTAGTLNDKVSALTLLIQESPLHSIKYFNMLHGLSKKKSKGSAMQAISAIKDLFIGGVLPNRKLKWFKNQPIQRDTDPRWLVLWAFEDWLKQYYFSFLGVLEVCEGLEF
jgi:ribosome biogenesis protein MAK21